MILKNTFYVILYELFIPRPGNTNDAYWRIKLENNGRFLLQVKDLNNAKTKAVKVYEENKKLQFRYLDNRFTIAKKESLKNSFLKKVDLIEEITHSISLD